jgi:hypothetical protein
MGTRSALHRAAFVSILLGAGLIAGQPAVAQGIPCPQASVDPGRDHSGEATVFTGIDDVGRAFTLTRNEETGTWSLWVITEFTRAEGGLEVGKPCIVIAGDESKVIVATADEATGAAAEPPADAAAAPAEPDVETYRVAGVRSGDVLDLRAGPGTDNESLVGIPRDGVGIVVGSCQPVAGYRYSWCEVSWQGTEGWASACCLESERTGKRPD